MEVERFKRLLIVSFFYRLFNPGFSTCHICGLPWNKCESKSITVNGNDGLFATCEHCWVGCHILD